MEILEMISEGLLLLFLGAGAVTDYKRKELSLIFLAAGFCMGIVIQTIIGKLYWYELLGGCALGGILLLIGYFSKQAVGYGDGLMVIVTGAFLGIIGNMLLLIGSLLLAGVVSVILLLIKKAKRKQAIPFVPFMLGGYVLLLALY